MPLKIAFFIFTSFSINFLYIHHAYVTLGVISAITAFAILMFSYEGTLFGELFFKRFF